VCVCVCVCVCVSVALAHCATDSNRDHPPCHPFQDIPTLNQYLQWTLVSSSLDSAMGSVTMSSTGALTVSSPGGLCPSGGVDRFQVEVRYSFSSYTGNLPAGYQPALAVVDILIGAATNTYPFFTGMPSSGSYSLSVQPLRGSSLSQSSTIPVSVAAPCGASVGYTLSVISQPVQINANGQLPSYTVALVRDGSRG
jgi:hypothetical protein